MTFQHSFVEQERGMAGTTAQSESELDTGVDGIHELNIAFLGQGKHQTYPMSLCKTFSWREMAVGPGYKWIAQIS